MVAVCDEELIGEEFKEGDLKIEITENFYGKESYSEDEVRSALKKATIANITGERSVKLAISMGIIDERRVLKIGKCWHAQMVVM